MAAGGSPDQELTGLSACVGNTTVSEGELERAESPQDRAAYGPCSDSQDLAGRPGTPDSRQLGLLGLRHSLEGWTCEDPAADVLPVTLEDARAPSRKMKC